MALNNKQSIVRAWGIGVFLAVGFFHLHGSGIHGGFAGGDVDFVRMFIHWAVVLVVTFALVCAFRDKKDGTE